MSMKSEAARNWVRGMSLDQVVERHMKFKGFQALVKYSLETGYTPHLITHPAGLLLHHHIRAEQAVRIANAFDWYMARNGHKKRVGRTTEGPTLTSNPEPCVGWMAPNTPGWTRVWSALGKEFDISYQEDGIPWVYCGTMNGVHDFRHRSYRGASTYAQVRAHEEDFIF